MYSQNQTKLKNSHMCICVCVCQCMWHMYAHAPSLGWECGTYYYVYTLVDNYSTRQPPLPVLISIFMGSVAIIRMHATSRSGKLAKYRTLSYIHMCTRPCKHGLLSYFATQNCLIQQIGTGNWNWWGKWVSGTINIEELVTILSYNSSHL